MKKIGSELKTFFDCKVYAVVLALVAAGAYGYAITHYAIGMDDTVIPLYFEDGLAPYVGRWSLFVLNKLFHIADFVPWFVELTSVIILMLSVTLWCVLWKRICEPKVTMPIWSYLFVAAVFLSCPLISEVFVFYLHNGICLGYGVTALAVWWFINSLSINVCQKYRCQQLVISALLLTVAMGFYESFSIVYIMGVVMCFFLARCLYGKKNDAFEIELKLLLWLRNGVLAVGLSIFFRLIILAILKGVYQLEKFGVYNVRYRSLFGDIFTNAGELAMVLKRFYVKYYVNAVVYLPITILVIAIALLVSYSIYYGIRKKDITLPLCTGVMVLLPIVMALIEGLDTRYRTAQYVPVVCAFAVLILLMEMHQHCMYKWSVICGYVILGVLIYNQCADMTRWLYVDDLKYQHTRETMNQIAYDLERDYDISKPIVFKGAYPVPYSICEDAYVSFQSWQYKVICALTDPIDPYLKEKFFSPIGFGFAESPLQSTITWGITAFDGTSQQLIEFWKMHGYDSFRCETDVELIMEAEQYGNEIGIPGFPKDGYIVECDDYILVSFSDAQ